MSKQLKLSEVPHGTNLKIKKSLRKFYQEEAVLIHTRPDGEIDNCIDLFIDLAIAVRAETKVCSLGISGKSNSVKCRVYVGAIYSDQLFCLKDLKLAKV